MSETTVSENQDSNEVGFYNIFDGTKGRTDSTYLDMQERVQAERQRAIVEGREPNLRDLGALPAGVGTPLVTKAQLVDNSVYSNPSVVHTDPEQEVDPVFTADVPVEDSAAATDTSYVDQASTESGDIPQYTGTEAETNNSQADLFSEDDDEDELV